MLRLDLQFYAFFVTVICGAVLGLLFDVLRTIRGYYQTEPWVGSIADLLFWIVTTATLFTGLFWANWADVRLYVLVGLLLGGGVYFWLASSIVVDLIRIALTLLGRIIYILVYLLLRIVWRPLIALISLVLRITSILWSFVYALFTGLQKLLCRLLPNVHVPQKTAFRSLWKYYRNIKHRLGRWLHL